MPINNSMFTKNLLHANITHVLKAFFLAITCTIGVYAADNGYISYSGKADEVMLFDKKQGISIVDYNLSNPIVQQYALKEYVANSYTVNDDAKQTIKIIYFGERKKYVPIDYAPALGMLFSGVQNYNAQLAQYSAGNTASGQSAAQGIGAGLAFGLLLGVGDYLYNKYSEDAEYLMITKACNDAKCTNIFSLFVRADGTNYDKKDIAEISIASAINTLFEKKEVKQINEAEETKKFENIKNSQTGKYYASRCEGFSFGAVKCNENKKIILDVYPDKKKYLADDKSILQVKLAMIPSYILHSKATFYIISDYGFKNGYKYFAVAENRINNIQGFPYNSFDELNDYLVDFKVKNNAEFEQKKIEYAAEPEKLTKYIKDADKFVFNNRKNFYTNQNIFNDKLSYLNINIVFFKEKPMEFVTWKTSSIADNSKIAEIQLLNEYFVLRYNQWNAP